VRNRYIVLGSALSLQRPIRHMVRIRRFFLILSLVAQSFPGYAASYDASASTETMAGDSSITYPLTVGSGANRQLVVFAWMATACAASMEPVVSSVTYNGVALTPIINLSPAAQCAYAHYSMWAMPAGTQPASGTHDVVVTLASAHKKRGRLRSGAMSFTGVDQTTTFTSTISAEGTGTAIAATLPSSGANDMVVMGTCHGGSLTSTTHTERWRLNSNGYNSCNNDGGATAAGGTTSLSWTGSVSDKWAIFGGSLKAAAASTVAFDNSAQAQSHFSFTYPLTVGSGLNRALAVFVNVGGNCTDTQSVYSVTYAGVALEQVVSQANATCSGAFVELWSLPVGTMPISGTNNVVVTIGDAFTGNMFAHTGAISASGVSQSQIFTSTVGNSGNGTAVTATLPSSGANDLVISGICNGNSVTSTGQTSRWIDNETTTGTCGNSGGATAAGGTTALSWTVATDYWVIVGASFKNYVKVSHKVTND
jgi:hypothetical protein